MINSDAPTKRIAKGTSKPCERLSQAPYKTWNSELQKLDNHQIDPG